MKYFWYLLTINSQVAHSTLIKSNVTEEVSRLKQQAGQDILNYGTGRLAQTLLQHGLIDEHRLWVIPVIWGNGQRIFEGMDTTKLKLVDNSSCYR